MTIHENLAHLSMLLLICEMSKTYWQMGKHRTKSDSENHLKARLFHSAQWLNVIPFLPRTSQDSINLARKCNLESSLGMT